MLTSIEQEKYRFHHTKDGREFEAVNPAQGLRLSFAPQGMDITPKKPGDRWHFGLSLKSYGYAEGLHQVPGVDTMLIRGKRG